MHATERARTQLSRLCSARCLSIQARGGRRAGSKSGVGSGGRGYVEMRARATGSRRGYFPGSSWLSLDAGDAAVDLGSRDNGPAESIYHQVW